MRAYTPGLYGTLISSVETHSITNPKLVDQSTFTLWHDRLGHPGKTMMYRIIENSNGHPLKDLKFLVKVVEHPVAHVHTQNGLAESLIKRLQLIARPLLMRSKLPSSAWGHAILHAESLIRFRPTAYHKFFPLQLVSGREPNISHLKVFGCAVYVPIPPPQRTKMGPQSRLGIYVGFESPSIIKYLEPMTGDQFTARLPDAFIDTKKVTKSHILAENVPARLEVPEVTLTQTKASESQIRRKRGRPLGSKDANPRKRKEHIVSINHDANVSTSNVSEDKIPEVILSEDLNDVRKLNCRSGVCGVDLIRDKGGGHELKTVHGLCCLRETEAMEAQSVAQAYLAVWIHVSVMNRIESLYSRRTDYDYSTTENGPRFPCVCVCAISSTSLRSSAQRVLTEI
ncbi:UNVERIFIED_CONTAM: hypothetical protein Scaly_1893500 [Sesamum calycinum]|uniref:GAG-pre-integrase domain-containing protein n=1 Tax=Sesamum calycinum TaxID=2727403 RepID=A0AAW2NHC6_9LAMI